jgi:hypothetical protein
MQLSTYQMLSDVFHTINRGHPLYTNSGYRQLGLPNYERTHDGFGQTTVDTYFSYIHLIFPLVSLVYIGYPMFCDVIWFFINWVFSFPEPWRVDRKHTTSFIKVISYHKIQNILFITYLLFIVTFIRRTAWRRNTHCDNKTLSYEC